MTRDYKRSSAPAKKGNQSMVTGVLIGLFLGLAIALGVALFINSSPSPYVTHTKPAPSARTVEPPASAPDAAPAQAPEPQKKSDASAEKPRFDFYTILPGTEEPVSEQEIKQAASKPQDATKDQYYLQLGSFQTEAEADNLKAKLALLGVEAVIQTATLPEKGVWHRVRVGPYASISDLAKVRSVLAQNGMEGSLIRVKEGAGQSQ